MIDRRTLLGAGALAASTAAIAKPARAKRHRRIATEEAFATPDWLTATESVPLSSPDGFEAKTLRGIQSIPQVRQGLLDFDHRLKVMDETGVDMHLLSLTTPGVQSLEREKAVSFASNLNDYLTTIIRQHPTRFAGLAAVAPQDPKSAATEIDRAMGKLGLNGVLINSYTNGEYLDHPKFEPIFEALVRNKAPLYIHPRVPAPAMAAPFADYGLSTAIWGFAADPGLHAMRLIMSGVFDRHPELTVVLGHSLLVLADRQYGSQGPPTHRGAGEATSARQASERVLSLEFLHHHKRCQFACKFEIRYRSIRCRPYHVRNRLSVRGLGRLSHVSGFRAYHRTRPSQNRVCQCRTRFSHRAANLTLG